MKELELTVPCDFSQAGFEDATLAMRNHHHNDYNNLELTVSVFDADGAIDMLVRNRFWGYLQMVHITPNYPQGKWKLTDTVNKVFIESEA